MNRTFVASSLFALALVAASCSSGKGSSSSPVAAPNLVYQRTVHYAGLNENVLIVKDPPRAYAVRADGRQESITDVNAEESQAWVRQFGALTPSLAAQLASAPADVPIPFAALVNMRLDWDDMQSRLTCRDPHTRRDAEAQLREESRLARVPAELLLKALGAQSVEAPTSILPVIFASALPANIYRIGDAASLVGITTIVGNPAVHAIPTDEPIATNTTSPIPFARIDAGFNAMGLYGNGQSVGFIENAQCGIYSQHEAFYYNQFMYQVEPTLCHTNSDCNFACDGSFDNGIDVFTRCVEGGLHQLARNGGSQCGFGYPRSHAARSC